MHYGQLELCRWLLDQTTWPDYGDALSNWPRVAENRAEAYRLFVDSVGIDVDLDPDSDIPEFWWSIPNKDCVAVILRNQSIPYHTRPIEERLELASKLSYDHSPDAYLQAVGLLRPDAQLAAAKTKTGWTAMHYVAEAAEWAPQEFKTAWIQLGTQLLEAGADASAIARGQNASFVPRGREKDVTPLLRYLSEALLRPNRFHDMLTLLQRLHTWISMVQAAGVDLHRYWERENKAWAALGVSQDDYDPTFDNHWREKVCLDPYPTRLIYGALPDAWSLECRNFGFVQTYKLQSPAGSYPRDHHVPDIIAWRPRPQEQDEGLWRPVSKSVLWSEPYDAMAGYRSHLERQKLRPQRSTRLDIRLESAQDDASSIILAERRLSRRRFPRQRTASVSRHSEFERGDFECEDSKDYWSRPEDFWWLPDSQRLGRRDNTLYYSSVFEQDGWLKYSFLAAIWACQENRWNHTNEERSNPAHTRRPGCPWCCDRVRLDKLQVPDSCREYHPGA